MTTGPKLTPESVTARIVSGRKTLSEQWKDVDLEIRGARRIAHVLAQRLALRRIRTVHSIYQPMSGRDLEVLQDAEEMGRIPRYGDVKVFETDLILQAQRRSDHGPVWIAVEVSNTIDQHDIARERSEILAGAYSQTALGVVDGMAIRQEERGMAESLGVTVVLL